MLLRKTLELFKFDLCNSRWRWWRLNWFKNNGNERWMQFYLYGFFFLLRSRESGCDGCTNCGGVLMTSTMEWWISCVNFLLSFLVVWCSRCSRHRRCIMMDIWCAMKWNSAIATLTLFCTQASDNVHGNIVSHTFDIDIKFWYGLPLTVDRGDIIIDTFMHFIRWSGQLMSHSDACRGLFFILIDASTYRRSVVPTMNSCSCHMTARRHWFIMTTPIADGSGRDRCLLIVCRMQLS